MPRYRLTAYHGHPFDDIDAADDQTAEWVARSMTGRAPTARGASYRLEVDSGGRWKLVRAWVPRWT